MRDRASAGGATSSKAKPDLALSRVELRGSLSNRLLAIAAVLGPAIAERTIAMHQHEQSGGFHMVRHSVMTLAAPRAGTDSHGRADHPKAWLTDHRLTLS